MFHNRRATRSIERLENRMMLAGDVTAQVTGGNLVLTGDLSSNRVSIKQISATEFEVQGQGNTTINTNSTPFSATGVTGSITANLGAGHDSIKVSGDIAADLNITTAEGNDRVTVYDATVAGNLTVDAGDGHNDVYLRNIGVTGNFSVTTGTGSDEVYVARVTAAVGTVNTGEGHDNLKMSRVDFSGALTVTTGDGTDLVNLDRLTVGGDLGVDLGPGNNDKLLARRTDVTGSANLDGGGGDQDKIVHVGLTATGSVNLNGFEVDQVLENLGFEGEYYGAVLGSFA